MPSKLGRIAVPYKDARWHILDADVLLYQCRGIISKLITVAGLSSYSHAGLAGWTNGNPASPTSRLMAYEMLWRGGQGSTLSSHVEKWPGIIDVYRVSDVHRTFRWDAERKRQVGASYVLDRKWAVVAMRDFCRPGEYGKMHLLYTALMHLPGFRFFFQPPTDDELDDRKRPPYCSEAVSYAIRRAFTDLVKNMPDHFTSPGDLARSPLLHYMFTLVGPTR